MPTTPISGNAIAYTTDINVIFSLDCTPAVPTGAAATSPAAILKDHNTGQSHPEMVIACTLGTGNDALVTLSNLAVGLYDLVVDFLPNPPGATGQRLTCAPLEVTVPS